jgi:hypothetical protein
MKVYVIRGTSACWVAGEVYETSEFYLVPEAGKPYFEVFAKSVFKLEIQNAEVVNEKAPKNHGRKQNLQSLRRDRS